MGRPEPAVIPEPVVELDQWLGPNAIKAALGISASLNHPRLLEHA